MAPKNANMRSTKTCTSSFRVKDFTFECARSNTLRIASIFVFTAGSCSAPPRKEKPILKITTRESSFIDDARMKEKKTFLCKRSCHKCCLCWKLNCLFAWKRREFFNVHVSNKKKETRKKKAEREYSFCVTLWWKRFRGWWWWRGGLLLLLLVVFVWILRRAAVVADDEYCFDEEKEAKERRITTTL